MLHIPTWGPRNNLVRKIQIQPSPRITRERLFLFSCLTLKFPRFQVTRSKHNASICNMSVTWVAPNDVAKVHIFYETVKQCPYYFVAGRGRRRRAERGQGWGCGKYTSVVDLFLFLFSKKSICRTIIQLLFQTPYRNYVNSILRTAKGMFACCR